MTLLRLLLVCGFLHMACSWTEEPDTNQEKDLTCLDINIHFNLVHKYLQLLEDKFEYHLLNTSQCETRDKNRNNDDDQFRKLGEQIKSLENDVHNISVSLHKLSNQWESFVATVGNLISPTTQSTAVPTTESLSEIGTFSNPASTCREIPQDSPSGEYWIQDGINTPVLMYCDMNRNCCNTTGGWTRVANLGTSDLNRQCPAGFTRYGNLCERPGSHSGCLSAVFPVNGVDYSRVCGRVLSRHWKRLQAFAEYYQDQNRTIDDLYVDGVSITHGQSPRRHIWTFAAGLNEDTSDYRGCPCNQNATYTGIIPPFVGEDYFCDTGRINELDTENYATGTLWDGDGCGPNSNCCSFHNPPWFCKQLPESTTDDIELRDCVVGSWGSGGGEVSLSIVEIYIN